MNYFSAVMSSLLSTAFIVFSIIALGYLLGRISIKGLSLGTAAVLLVALAYGIIASKVPYISIGQKHIVLYLSESVTLEDGTVLAATKGIFSFISSLGTSIFVAAVGLIAGPKFFRSMSRKFLSYILMGILIIAIGSLTAIAVLFLSRDENLDPSLVVGLMTGALTSTPGLAAAKEIAADEAKCTAGYGIGYLFGVLGVVLFVQLLPRLLHADLEKERAAFNSADQLGELSITRKLSCIEPTGIFVFSLTILFGSLLGSLRIPKIDFSLGSSGGILLAGVLIGHFGHIGPIDCRVKRETLRLLQELGLCFFLVGAGVPGGINFISNVKLSYFLYGAAITLLPMIVGFLLGRYVFRMSLFNNLGSITGGMTSTPALGALISSSGIEDVVGPYAATYPFALLCVVLSARIIVSIF